MSEINKIKENVRHKVYRLVSLIVSYLYIALRNMLCVMAAFDTSMKIYCSTDRCDLSADEDSTWFGCVSERTWLYGGMIFLWVLVPICMSSIDCGFCLVELS